MSLQRTIRTRTSESCIEEKINLRRVTKTRNNLVKGDNEDLLADFSQLLKVRSVSDVRQRDVHTHEPLVPGPSRLKV
jgi:hypothetical protein